MSQQTNENFKSGIPGLTASEFRGQTRVVVPPESLIDVFQSLKEKHGFDLLVDMTCVDYLDYPGAPRTASAWSICWPTLRPTSGSRCDVS